MPWAAIEIAQLPRSAASVSAVATRSSRASAGACASSPSRARSTSPNAFAIRSAGELPRSGASVNGLGASTICAVVQIRLPPRRFATYWAVSAAARSLAEVAVRVVAVAAPHESVSCGRRLPSSLCAAAAISSISVSSEPSAIRSTLSIRRQNSSPPSRATNEPG